MKETKGAGLVDRLKASALARQALLAKLRPKPAVVDPQFGERGVEAAATLKAVRAERKEARAAKAVERASVAVEAGPSAVRPPSNRQQAAPPTEAEAKIKRDARYAARQSRRG